MRKQLWRNVLQLVTLPLDKIKYGKVQSALIFSLQSILFVGEFNFKRLVNFVVTLWKNKRGTDAVFKACAHWRAFGIPVRRHHLTLYGVGPYIQKHPMKKTRVTLDRTWRDLCKENSNNNQDIATEMKEIAQHFNLLSRPVGFTQQNYLVPFNTMTIRKKTDTTHR